MMEFIKAWTIKDAKWYEFWMPQSGFIGGTILCAIICIPAFICCTYL